MVHNCTTSNTSTNSFLVRCFEGFNGGLPQSFLLEVRESNSQELRANLTSPVPRFSVTRLESGALYQACIYAYNDKGRSEAMMVQAGTLRLPEKQLTSESGEFKSLFHSVLPVGSNARANSSNRETGFIPIAFTKRGRGRRGWWRGWIFGIVTRSLSAKQFTVPCWGRNCSIVPVK